MNNLAISHQLKSLIRVKACIMYGEMIHPGKGQFVVFKSLFETIAHCM